MADIKNKFVETVSLLSDGLVCLCRSYTGISNKLRLLHVVCCYCNEPTKHYKACADGGENTFHQEFFFFFFVSEGCENDTISSHLSG